MKEISINIQQIVKLLFASGDIDNRNKQLSKNEINKIKGILKTNTQIEGINDKYISTSMEFEDLKINFYESIPIVSLPSEDIIKKVIVPEDGFEEIDEEMLYSPLNELKLYAYLYIHNKNIENIKVSVVFISSIDLMRAEKEFLFSKEELKSFFEDTLNKYLKWDELTLNWKKERKNSINIMKFPFEKYREGQKKLVKCTYITISENKKLFVQAPTGIGKTISSLYPAVKKIGEGTIDKIFYLTAKTVGTKVAEESFDKMRANGLKFRNITLTAKDKVCLMEKTNCNPTYCKYAKNYYGKINNVIFEMLSKESVFTRNIIEEYALKYKVCPFELSLDLSIWTDAVICDYNYVFDPNVYLKRFFENGTCNATCLVDESHNLIDRAREMFSAEIPKRNLTNALEFCKDKLPFIEDKLTEIINYIEDREKEGKGKKDDAYVLFALPTDFITLIENFSNAVYTLFKRNKNNSEYDKLIEIYMNCNAFLKIAELFDENYVFYVNPRNDAKVKLFCLNPAKNLKTAHKRVKSCILFSATLTPLPYFRDMLGGEKDDYGLMLESPFSTENRELVIADNISTRYKDRTKSYGEIAEYINNMISGKTGNYMVFFPSFDYMENVKERFVKKYPDVKTIVQGNSMSELDREVFLAKFQYKPSRTMVAFCVFGLYSEGIDLVSEKLIGAAIVGAGLPMVCLERNLIKEFFDEKYLFGFDYSYTYPGVSKVLQSAGRVIRTTTDKGIILLIDDRLGTNKYMSLYPKDWFPNKRVKKPEELRKIVDSFWNKK